MLRNTKIRNRNSWLHSDLKPSWQTGSIALIFKIPYRSTVSLFRDRSVRRENRNVCTKYTRAETFPNYGEVQERFVCMSLSLILTFIAGVHKFRTFTFCTVARNICGPTVWNSLHVNRLVPRIVEVVPKSVKICSPLI